MLLKLVLTKEKSFCYKIKIKKEKELLLATAPHPKNEKQKNKLIDFLTPFEKRIIYPLNFCKKDYPAAYPAFEIYCKKLLERFLNLCKEKRPDIAVITPKGLIKNNFYFDLSQHVGRIILLTKERDENLKKDMLAFNGTVIEFKGDFDKNAADALRLTMPDYKKTANTINFVDFFNKKG